MDRLEAHNSSDVELVNDVRAPNRASTGVDVLGHLDTGASNDARTASQEILGRPEADNEQLSAALSVIAMLSYSDGRVRDAEMFATAAVSRDARRRSLRHSELVLTTVRLATGQRLGPAPTTFSHACADEPLAPVALALAARLQLSGPGGLETADDLATESLLLANKGTHTTFLPLALAVSAEVSLRQQDQERTRQLLSELRELTAPAFGLGAVDPIWTAARLAATEGAHAVMKATAPLFAHPAGHATVFTEHHGAAAWFVRSALRAGNQTAAEQIAGYVDALAYANPGIVSIQAMAQHARGILAWEPEILLAAATQHLDLWSKGSALEDLAVVLGDDGQFAEAIEALQSAQADYQALGASGDLNRVADRLNKLEAQRRPPRGRARPVTGWDSLTPAERRVARAVAGGRTNAEAAQRLYVSTHTVGFHLRQIYRKLGVNSRTQMTRLVLDHFATESTVAPQPDTALINPSE